MTDDDKTIIGFGHAEVGDEAYTWELDGCDWGDYKFETVDPQDTGAWGEVASWDTEAVLIRKRWRLIETSEIRPEPQPVDDDEEDDAMFSDVKFVGTFTVGSDMESPAVST